MSRVCQSTGKRTRSGGSIARRGLAKSQGGVGIKTTGITRRTFKPNVQKVRVVTKNGTVRRMKVCAKCLRSGMISKPLRRDIPEGLRQRMRAKEQAKSPAARRQKAKEAGNRRRKRRAEAAARKSG